MANRYVDPVNGVDSGAGGVGAPWKTLAYTIAQATTGDTVNLLAGDHTLAANQESTKTLHWVGETGTRIVGTAGSVYMLKTYNAGIAHSFTDVEFYIDVDTRYIIYVESTVAAPVYTRCKFTATANAAFTNNTTGIIKFLRRSSGAVFTDCEFDFENASGGKSLIWTEDATGGAAAGTEAFTITGCTFTANCHGSTMVNIQDQPGVLIENNTFNDTTPAGTSGGCVSMDVLSGGTPVACDNGIIRNNTFNVPTRVAGTVIRVGADSATTPTCDAKLQNWLIENNRINGPWKHDPELTAVGGSLHGILVSWAGKANVRNNIVDGSCYGIIIKGGATDWNYQGGVYHNLLINCPHSGVYSKGCAKVHIFNNTFYHDEDVATVSGIGQIYFGVNDANANSALSVSDNIIYGTTSKPAISMDAAGTAAHSYARNCYYCPDGTPNFAVGATTYANIMLWQAGVSSDQQSFVSDPQFADTTHKCFKILANSPCAKGVVKGSEDIMPANLSGIIFAR